MAAIKKLSAIQKNQAENQRKNVARQRVLEMAIRKQSKQLMLFKLLKDTQKTQVYETLLKTNRRKLALLVKNTSYLTYDKYRSQVTQ